MRRADVQWFRDQAREKGLSRLALDVYLALLRFDAMGRAEPSLATLASETGATDRGVRKALRHLETAGWVSTHARRRQTSVYVPNLRRNGVPGKDTVLRRNSDPERRSADLSLKRERGPREATAAPPNNEAAAPPPVTGVALEPPTRGGWAPPSPPGSYGPSDEPGLKRVSEDVSTEDLARVERGIDPPPRTGDSDDAALAVTEGEPAFSLKLTTRREFADRFRSLLLRQGLAWSETDADARALEAIAGRCARRASPTLAAQHVLARAIACGVPYELPAIASRLEELLPTPPRAVVVRSAKAAARQAFGGRR